MIVKGTVRNGGWTGADGGSLMINLSVDEIAGKDEALPSRMRGRSIALVVFDLPEKFSLTDAASLSSVADESGEPGDDGPTVEETR